MCKISFIIGFFIVIIFANSGIKKDLRKNDRINRLSKTILGEAKAVTDSIQLINSEQKLE